MLDEKLITPYLARKGMNATAVRQDLVVTLGLDAVSYPTTARIVGETLLTHEQSPAIEPGPFAIDLAITQALCQSHLLQFLSRPKRHGFRKPRWTPIWRTPLGSQRDIYVGFLTRYLGSKSAFPLKCQRPS
jgi:hypothetical protein